MTILSTTLKNLARRGFNVERVISARKAEREAADERMRQERAQAQLKAAQTLVSGGSGGACRATLIHSPPHQSPEKFAAGVSELQQLLPDADPAYLAQVLQQQQASHVENAANVILANPNYPRRPPAVKDTRPPPYRPADATAAGGAKQALQSAAMAPTSSGDKGLFSSLKRQFARPDSRERAGSTGGGAGFGASMGGSSAGESSTLDAPQRPKPPSMVPSTPAATPTDTEAIRQNVRRAIQVRCAILAQASHADSLLPVGLTTRHEQRGVEST